MALIDLLIKPPAPPGMKWKKVREYGPSLRQRISRAENEEELEGIRREVVLLARAKEISEETLKKLEKAGRQKAKLLAGRLVILPPKRGIIIP